MTSRLFGLILCFLVVLSIACDQGTAPPPTREPFFFRVVVKDQAGNPMPNVRVSVYPPFDPSLLLKSSTSQSSLSMNASTTLNFAMARAARVNLSLSDLDGTPIQKLIENRLLNAGQYAYTLSLQRTEGARVMVCRFVVSDTATGYIAFRDSIYVTLWQPDAQIAILGYTSGSGTFESRDTLAFPYVLSLPPIVVTRYDPTPLETFSFPDSCLITLTDTAQATRMTFGQRLVHGPNEITVTWNPTGSPSPMLRGGTSSDLPPSALSSGRQDAFDWRLFQNYPNPFN
jgi:hypothetical protein